MITVSLLLWVAAFAVGAAAVEFVIAVTVGRVIRQRDTQVPVDVTPSSLRQGGPP